MIALVQFFMTMIVKAKLSIKVTLFGIVIFVSDEHFSKAYLPIKVTLFGIKIFVSEKQLLKAQSQIEETLFGIEIPIRSLQFLYSEYGIEEVPSGTTTYVAEKCFSRSSSDWKRPHIYKNGPGK